MLEEYPMDRLGDGVLVARLPDEVVLVPASAAAERVRDPDLWDQDTPSEEMSLAVENLIRLRLVDMIDQWKAPQAPNSIMPTKLGALRAIGSQAAELADGLTSELQVALAGLRDVRVVSQMAAMAYRGHTTDPKTIGAEPGARYALHGSLQHSLDRLRVQVELADCETGVNVWSPNL